MGNILLLLIGLLFLVGVLVPFIYPVLKKRTGVVLSVLPLVIFIVLLLELLSIGSRESIILDSTWGFLSGMEFSYRLDGLSIIFGLLISGIGFLILLFSSYYMAKYDRQPHFYTYLTLFMGAMTGLVFADNLFVLFVFWELTSVASFFLIGFDHHLEKSRQASLQALLITAFGGLCLLFAIILTGNITGTYRISELINYSIHLGNHPHYYLILSLVLLAAITKSAQFPFHFWLPGAMQAPTPISAYLHSATMVNAGVFLLLRLYPVIGGTVAWKYLLILTGGITMFLGAFLSMGQRDLKRILAFTTISALGTMVLLIGIDTPNSIKAAIVFFIVHGLYKGGLFMIAGIIDKSTGSRDIYELNGLFRGIPVTAIAALLAVISMAGLPPMLGFVGKELVYEAQIQAPGISWIVLPLGVGANILMVAVSITVFYELFVFNKNKPATKFKYHERQFPVTFLAGAVLLAILGLGLGMSPRFLENILSNALYYIQGHSMEIKLRLWHGFNQVLMLSIFTIFCGVAIFLFRKPVNRVISTFINWLDRYHLPTLFTSVINYYIYLASKNTRRIQHGYHRFYLLTFFLVTIALISLQQFRITEVTLPESGFSPVKWHVALLLFIASLSVIFAVFAKTRLSAILAMGVIGYGIGMLYLFYGAVDLAITQFLVETIIMIVFVMVIYYLPRFAILSSKTSRIRDGIISIAVGAFVTLIVLKAQLIKPDSRVSDFFVENSYTLAHGKNIINTILIDFRSLDTLGEMVVITMAAAGVFSLFRFQIQRLKKKEEKKE
ncbi:hydrogen gas-evolving membrane-bound hydrogenase subunit E [Natronoflexus pectinivorans]|uniref:Multicomponent Na+:H+ antiporter subunit A n=1 Tax=Natronoflexus pectinivorans TaxID=682526 RepID=A0A4R2GJ40_9BACT|nr:hydrogen gas-evolving membrane-bound hydrogenase subunit E [Natronoflexus pectinivorans]TCO08731.1 multicomponent Na+:H+ antiporter subunit A [Natronoflexus pectinivorans]